jgi:hypothetical protein
MPLKDISVVIPTRNCRDLIQSSTALMREWANEVGEIVVVDSQSSDGTVELLRELLPFPHVKFLSHPPGLYASWNFGIQNCSLPLTYIATAGDSISAADLAFLANTAASTAADVVVCPPVFTDASGTSAAPPSWPIHDLMELTPDGELIELSGAELTAFALTHCSPPLRYHAWTGSAASNIYRSAILKQHPFPEDAGHSGDTLWAVQQSRFVKAVFCRRSCGSFYVHTEPKVLDAYEQMRIFTKFHAACHEALEWMLQQDDGLSGPLARAYLRQSSQNQKMVMELIAALTSQQGAIQAEMKKKEHHKLRCAELTQQLDTLRSQVKNGKAAMSRVKKKIPRWVLKLFGVSHHSS